MPVSSLILPPWSVHTTSLLYSFIDKLVGIAEYLKHFLTLSVAQTETEISTQKYNSGLPDFMVQFGMDYLIVFLVLNSLREIFGQDLKLLESFKKLKINRSIFIDQMNKSLFTLKIPQLTFLFVSYYQKLLKKIVLEFEIEI